MALRYENVHFLILFGVYDIIGDGDLVMCTTIIYTSISNFRNILRNRYSSAIYHSNAVNSHTLVKRHLWASSETATSCDVPNG